MTKEKSTLATLKDLIENLEMLNKKVIRNPLLFYTDVGRQVILASKELHLFGAKIMQSKTPNKKLIEILKKIPLEK